YEQLFTLSRSLLQKTRNSCRHYCSCCHNSNYVLETGTHNPLRLVARSSRLPGALLVILSRHLLEELCQASDQPVAAADDMQASLVLMLFQDFVQSAL